jgi:hypothetical protein
VKTTRRFRNPISSPTRLALSAAMLSVAFAGRAIADEVPAPPAAAPPPAVAPPPAAAPPPATTTAAAPAATVTVAVTAPAVALPPAPPPPPYSLPWQLRPATVATVVRSDSTVAFYDGANGTSGSTVATMLLGSYKVSPNFAPLVRLGFVQNTAPGMAPDGQSFVNPLVGATYARPAGPIRLAATLAVTVPVGQGGAGTPANSGSAGANAAGIAARSGMDNAMFAVNYFTFVGGIDAAYIAHGFTAQLEATVLQLTRVRTSTGDSSRTNGTAGLHLGYFLIPQLSLGGEVRYQRWLTDAAPVKANPVNRDTVTMAIGPRAHFKMGKTWFRPGISYSRGLDKPLTTSSYNMVQVDLPFAF